MTFFHFGNNLQQHFCSYYARYTTVRQRGKTASFDLKGRDNNKTAACTMRNTTIYSIQFRTTFFIHLSSSSTQSALSLKENLKLSKLLHCHWTLCSFLLFCFTAHLKIKLSPPENTSKQKPHLLAVEKVSSVCL